MAILALGETRIRRDPNLRCKGLTDLGDVTLCQKKKACKTAVEHVGALS